MTSRRAGTSAVVLTVLAVGLMLLMIMFAARSGPQRIIHGTLRDPSLGPVTPSYPSRTLAPFARNHRGDGFLQNNTVFRALGLLIGLALVALVVWAAFYLLRWVGARLLGHRLELRPEQVDFDVLDDPEPLAEEIRADAADQLALLLGGTPRNAIVACWDRFEEQAERVHASRKDWETSSEFTLRLLEQVSADSAAVNRLEVLYHEARFSSHEIDESRREAAVEALRAIHRSLGAKVVSG
jgi:Domain of unknown function (DUF4129)